MKEDGGAYCILALHYMADGPMGWWAEEGSEGSEMSE